MWLAYILVFHNDKPVLGIFCAMLQALIMITVNGVAEPFVDKIESRMHLFNEFFVVILCYHLFPLTDFMTDLEIRNNYVG
jgi:hypothetical protein